MRRILSFVFAALALVACGQREEFQGPGALGGRVVVTSQQVVDNQYGSTHLEWIDEMLYLNILQSAGNGNAGYWSAPSSGTVAFSGTAAAGRPGVLDVSATTATTGRVAMMIAATSVDFGSATWVYEATLGFPTLSTAADEYTAIFGFIDNSAGRDEVDGCYFAYDRGNAMTNGSNTGNADKFSCWCASNSTRTTFLMDGTTTSNESFVTVNAPVAALTLPNTNIYTLKVAMTGTTRAEFFVNGTKSCDINTNIPSGATRVTGFGQFLMRGAATAARAYEIDRVRVAADLNSARSP